MVDRGDGKESIRGVMHSLIVTPHTQPGFVRFLSGDLRRIWMN